MCDLPICFKRCLVFGQPLRQEKVKCVVFRFRRVVTGHDDQARAVIINDELLTSEPRLPGYEAKVAWCTPQFPPSNDGVSIDEAADGPWGGRVLFRVAEFQPGEFNAPNVHRTETQDIALILSGELDMVLEDGVVVERLGPGDMVVQRGTTHSWVPRGHVPIRVLFVLMDAPPARVGDQVLNADLSTFGGRLHPMPPVK